MKYFLLSIFVLLALLQLTKLEITFDELNDNLKSTLNPLQLDSNFTSDSNSRGRNRDIKNGKKHTKNKDEWDNSETSIPKSEFCNNSLCFNTKRNRRQISTELTTNEINKLIKKFTVIENGIKTVDTTKLMSLMNDANLNGLYTHEKQLLQAANYARTTQEFQLSGDYQSLINHVTEAGSYGEFLSRESAIHANSAKLTKPSKFNQIMGSHHIGTIVSCLPMLESFFHIYEYCHAERNDTLCHHSVVMAGVGIGVVGGQIVLSSVTVWGISKYIDLRLAKLPNQLWGPVLAARTELEASRRAMQTVASFVLESIFLIVGLGFESYALKMQIDQLTTCYQSDCDKYIKSIIIFSISMTCFRAGLMIFLYFFSALLTSIQIGLIFLAVILFERIITAMITLASLIEKYEMSFLEVTIVLHIIPTDFGDVLSATQPVTLMINLLRAESSPLIEALKCSTIVMEAANTIVTQMLTEKSSSDSIVAVAVATGVVKSTQDTKISPDFAKINMRDRDEKYGRNLARVIPKQQSHTVQLCLPSTDRAKTLNGGTGSDPVSTVVYSCEGALVLGHKDRWNILETGSIFYHLYNADRAEIWGHDKYDNYYMLKDIKATIYSGQSTNTYDIQGILNDGVIYSNEKSRSETIIWSRSNYSGVVTLNYNLIENRIQGILAFGDSKNHLKWDYPLEKIDSTNNSRIRQIIGRTNESDIINCGNTKLLTKLKTAYNFLADGRGGKLSNMDIITNCQSSTIQPFTDITVMKPDTWFMVTAFLTGILKYTTETVYSIINLKNNARMLFKFSGRPLYMATISMTYSAKSNILTWKFLWSPMKIMILDIKGYFSKNTTLDEKDELEWLKNKIPAVSIFDVYSNGRFIPVIPEKLDDQNSFDITDYQTEIQMDSSEVKDAINVYHMVQATKEPKFNIRLSVKAKNNQSYEFGTDGSDKLYLDEALRYAAALNGPDYYILYPTSPEYVWIDNQAFDYELDTIIITEKISDLPKVRRLTYFNASIYDIVVECSLKFSSYRINVIIENYLASPIYQHLTIMWGDVHYLIVPENWSLSDNLLDEFTLVPFFSLRSKNLPVYNVESDGPSVLYVWDRNQAFYGYIENRLHVLLKQEGNQTGSIRLWNFWISDRSGKKMINPKWMNKIFIVVDDLINDKDDYRFNYSDVLKMIAAGTKKTEESFKESEKFRYEIRRLQRTNIFIDLSTEFSDSDLTKVLFFNGISPKDIDIHWNNSIDNLGFCTKKACAFIANWCLSKNYRLNTIEIVEKNSDDIVKILNVDEFDCESNSPNNQDKLVQNLKNKIQKAELVQPYMRNGRADREIFHNCLMILYSKIVTLFPTFRLFGFPNMFYLGHYYQENCVGSLAILQNRYNYNYFVNFTFEKMNSTVEKNINKFKALNELNPIDWPDKEYVFKLLREGTQNRDVWYKLQTLVYKELFKIQPVDFKHIDILKTGRLSELPWYERYIRYTQQCNN